MSNYMVCFSSDNLEDFVKQRGCGYWRAAASSIKWADYLVCIKNKNGVNSKWKGEDDKHHQAFLIAKINEHAYIESGKRKIVTFDEFAILDADDAAIITWQGQSPIAYYEKEALKKDSEGVDLNKGIFDPSTLDWQRFSDLADKDEVESDLALSVKDAKKALSKYYNVAEDKVSITITIDE
ncbi:hypothetical protein L4D76_28195 [Photobacterium sagamiensis]|uniref:hypothetical protein n=1 Tax=Photobacterium sagamiensis TaxID=2910241 RepID=UPI003D14B34C